MNNNMYDYEVDLRDLLLATLRKWRSILIIAFTAAFLLGGIKCVKEFLNQRDDEYVSTLKKEYEDDLEQYEQAKKGYIRDINNFTSSIDYQEKYKENSILLKIDPYNKGVASVDIFVRMSELPQTNGTVVTTIDFTDGVVKAYASAIQQGSAMEQLSKSMKIDLVYLKELITVTEDYDSNMLNVSVNYPDEKGAKSILSEILRRVDSIYPEIQASLGDHSIAIMNRNIGISTDQIMADYQKKKILDLADTNTKLKDAEKALKELQEPAKPVTLSKMAIIKQGIKFGVVGWLAGAFLTVCIVCITILFDKKIRTDCDLKKRFGLKLLGNFVKEKKKKLFSIVDDWLDCFEEKEYVPDELVYEMVATNIQNYNINNQKVFITGTVKEEVLNKFVINLQKRLPNLKLGYGVNMNRNVFTLKEISKYDQIVLVEARKQSKLKAVEEEVETILNMNKEVMGYIILDCER